VKGDDHIHRSSTVYPSPPHETLSLPTSNIIPIPELQLVLLCPTRNLPELLLWNSPYKPLHPFIHLSRIRLINLLPRPRPYQRLNLQQRLTIQVFPKPLIDFLQHLLYELPIRIHILRVNTRNDLINETNLHHFLRADTLGHDERLVGLGDAETLDECGTGASFGDETEGAERREEEGVGHGVYEVREGD
jgi:hypothetical protein